MPNKRLNIIKLEQTQEQPSKNYSSIPARKARLKELQARFERLWLLDPEQFNPMRNIMEQERLERTWGLLKKHMDPHGKQTTDIGCAAGVFSRRLRDAGAHVTAADIAENALKHLKQHEMHHIEAKQEAMPFTHLPDGGFDLAVCTEVIADLPPEDYRLFFAELLRVIKPEGRMICSSGIDIYYSFDGAQRLLDLANTEFEIIEVVPSYHALYLRLKHLCEAPSTFIEGWKNKDLRQKELDRRQGLSHWFYWINTTFLFMWLWIVLQMLFKPFLSLLNHNRTALLFLEKVCRLFSTENGISHVIFIAKRRPLIEPDLVEPPSERPRKKEIWT